MTAAIDMLGDQNRTQSSGAGAAFLPQVWNSRRLHVRNAP